MDLSPEFLFLGVAISLAVIFLAILIVDQFRRRKRGRRRRGQGKAAVTSLGLLGQLRVYVRTLKKAAHQRSRRAARDRRTPPPGVV